MGASLLTLRRKENAYDLLLQGGAEGLKLTLTILPALVMLLTAVQLLKASGAVELLGGFWGRCSNFLESLRKRRFWC